MYLVVFVFLQIKENVAFLFCLFSFLKLVHHLNFTSDPEISHSQVK